MQCSMRMLYDMFQLIPSCPQFGCSTNLYVNQNWFACYVRDSADRLEFYVFHSTSCKSVGWLQAGTRQFPLLSLICNRYNIIIRFESRAVARVVLEGTGHPLGFPKKNDFLNFAYRNSSFRLWASSEHPLANLATSLFKRISEPELIFGWKRFCWSMYCWCFPFFISTRMRCLMTSYHYNYFSI